jgi:hypothetical protein
LVLAVGDVQVGDLVVLDRADLPVQDLLASAFLAAVGARGLLASAADWDRNNFGLKDFHACVLS